MTQNPFVADSLDAVYAELEALELNGYSTVTIPVVVHVVHSADVSESNISDAQISSQITQLNSDFGVVTSEFTSITVVDTKIRFVLSQTIRVQTNVQSFETNSDRVKHVGTGSVASDATTHLNIWVCNLRGAVAGDGGEGGYATTAQYNPGQVGNPDDGIVVDYRFFGTTGTLSARWNGGHTATHEIGHWLGLEHPWGPDDSKDACHIADPDHVGDTPRCNKWTSLDCSINEVYSCTGERRMVENFMDYSADACRRAFTAGQTALMRKWLKYYRPGFEGHKVLVTSSYGHGTFSAAYFLPDNTLRSRSDLAYGSTIAVPDGLTLKLTAVDNQAFPFTPRYEWKYRT